MLVEYENGKVLSVKRNSCPRGEKYAVAEITNPVRIVTSTVKVINGSLPVVPVKTSEAIKRELIKAVMNEIRKAVVKAPISEGQIILENPVNCGADIISTLELS